MYRDDITNADVFQQLQARVKQVRIGTKYTLTYLSPL